MGVNCCWATRVKWLMAAALSSIYIYIDSYYNYVAKLFGAVIWCRPCRLYVTLNGIWSEELNPTLHDSFVMAITAAPTTTESDDCSFLFRCTGRRNWKRRKSWSWPSNACAPWRTDVSGRVQMLYIPYCVMCQANHFIWGLTISNVTTGQQKWD